MEDKFRVEDIMVIISKSMADEETQNKVVGIVREYKPRGKEVVDLIESMYSKKSIIEFEEYMESIKDSSVNDIGSVIEVIEEGRYYGEYGAGVEYSFNDESEDNPFDEESEDEDNPFDNESEDNPFDEESEDEDNPFDNESEDNPFDNESEDNPFDEESEDEDNPFDEESEDEDNPFDEESEDEDNPFDDESRDGNEESEYENEESEYENEESEDNTFEGESDYEDNPFDEDDEDNPFDEDDEDYPFDEDGTALDRAESGNSNESEEESDGFEYMESDSIKPIEETVYEDGSMETDESVRGMEKGRAEAEEVGDIFSDRGTNEIFKAIGKFSDKFLNKLLGGKS